MRFLLSLFLIPLLGLAADNPGWRKPYPAHRIAGNLYYVGTEDLACFLITTPQGHILINTGLEDSTPLLRDSFRQLGFKLEDVKILLTMQAHFDHNGAMAEVKQITGAKLYATAPDAKLLESGGKADPGYPDLGSFKPVKVDQQIKEGDVLRLGSTELTVVFTPGHSPGSSSYLMTVEDGGQRRQVGIVNLPTVVMPLVGNRKYPGIVTDLEHTFAREKQLHPDIWVAAHASQYDMDAKRKAGSFVDPAGYRQAVEGTEKAFRQRLARENDAKQR